MVELLESAHIFEASTKLQFAATCLSKIAGGEKPTQQTRDILTWTGTLLMRVDWRRDEWASAAYINPVMATQATAVRPVFFETFFKWFKEAKREVPDIGDFLKLFYSFLRSGGVESKLTSEQLDLAAQFLQAFSENLLSRISTNGIPKPNPVPVFA